jgi:hypothetical protein
VSGVQAWTAANFPREKIILGVGSYGHSYSVQPSDAIDASGNIQLNPPFNKDLQPAGDKWDGVAGGVDQCGNPNVVGGIFDFWGLIEGGFLDAEGKAVSGINYRFDECSETVRALYMLIMADSLMSISKFSLTYTIPHRRCWCPTMTPTHLVTPRAQLPVGSH